MKVYFSASTGNMAEHIDAYRKIRDVILANGHSLTRDWLEVAHKRLIVKHAYTTEEISQIYSLSIAALVEADVVILDATQETFNMGYQAGMAVHYKKPLLVLTNNHEAHISFLIGEPNILKKIEEYVKISDIEPIITRFFEANDPSGKDTRFNMVLGLNLHNYLSWESDKTGRPKSQIIRDILEKYIDDQSK